MRGKSIIMGKKKYRNKPKEIPKEEPKKKPIDRWLGLFAVVVGLMKALLPTTPPIIIGWLLFIFILLLYPVWNFWWIEKNIRRRSGALLIIVCILVIIGFISWPIQQPEIHVGIELCPDHEYKYPLQAYSLIIQNINPKSVSITDCRIEFVFKNTIVNIKPVILSDTGSNIVMGGAQLTKQTPNGPIVIFEEQPVDTSITKNFSLNIQQYKVNGKNINTNILLFHCARWPEKMDLGADIIVDLSKEPMISKKPDRGEVYYYEGIYFYEIGGQKFSQKINGSIPSD